jgi:hypothetical protein
MDNTNPIRIKITLDLDEKNPLDAEPPPALGFATAHAVSKLFF